MKQLISILLLCILTPISTFAVKAYFHYAPFYAPTIGTYVETYLAIDPNSVAYKMNSDGKLQASVEVTMLFKNGEEIREYRKYNISSPEIDPEMNQSPKAFIDLQRIPLLDGAYNFELKIKDNHSLDTVSFAHKDILTVTIPQNEMAFSGIEPAESFSPSESVTKFTKSGLEIIPYVSNFYPENINSVTFYSELYNIHKEVGENGDFLIRYFVTSIPSRRTFEKTISFERRKAAPIVPITKSVNISDLPSGNYNLEIEVRDKNNQLLLSKKHFFQRSSSRKEDTPSDFTQIDLTESWVLKYTTAHELSVHIKSLYPIAGNVERRFIDTDFTAKDLTMMQQFFINFWESRNSISPENEWNIYLKQVELVEKLYGTQIKRGYMTDRGRVYLQYGSPNQIIARKHPSYFKPYEIWHYYKINDKTNRRFIFNQAKGGSLEYDLLHSDMIGEINIPDWIEMMKAPYIDATAGTKFNDEYEQLRRDYKE